MGQYLFISLARGFIFSRGDLSPNRSLDSSYSRSDQSNSGAIASPNMSSIGSAYCTTIYPIIAVSTTVKPITKITSTAL